ncbi:MAG: prepilin peptidase [Aquificaceae bacterium]|nr:prepilin peptidase [Aquificaceae bacterium]
MHYQLLEYALLFVVGSVFGSFYNVLIYRIPRGISILSPPSRCPHCGVNIRWFDNIPIISYLILLGKCRHCKGKISLRYPIVEATAGILTVLCRLKFEDFLTALVFFVFFSMLLVASLIDWDTFTLPDELTLGGLVFGLLSASVRTDFSLAESLTGALTGAGIFLAIYLYFKKIRKTEGLGFGDVKLIAFIGSVAGVWGVIYAIFLGSIFGLLYALPIIMKSKSLQFALPFGPFLSLGTFVGVFLDVGRWFRETLLF